MKIIAGTARRTVLEVAEHSATRPFLEMARGALFNSLGGRVTEARVLDLYAGSGALGLEALSRGAAECVFVEADPRAYAALGRNIARCGMADRAEARRSTVAAFAAAATGEFDLIFVDPPFAELGQWRHGGGEEAVMRTLSERLVVDGTLVFRLEDRTFPPPDWPGLRLEVEKRYGRSRVCRYRHETGAVGTGEAGR